MFKQLKFILCCSVSFIFLWGNIVIAAGISTSDLKIFKGEKGRIKISGGTAHIPVMKELAHRIIRYNPKIRISIAGGGSGVGIKQVGEGLVDIGNSGRRPSTKEIKKYHLQLFKWAIDGVAIVVNPKNTVQQLSTMQLQDIYAGRLTNWKDVGGKDKRINLYTRDNASGTRSVFWKKALKKGNISDKANFVISNGAMKTSISNDPYSIGYISVGYIDRSVLPVALDGVYPTLKNVKNGCYKVARGLYSNTVGTPNSLTGKFIKFIYSETGRKVIQKKGFIAAVQPSK